MKRVRNNVGYLLIVVLTLSLWTNTASSCDTENFVQMQETAEATTILGESTEAIELASHPSSSGPLESIRVTDASTAGPPDCLDCVVLCPIMGASAMVNPSLLIDLSTGSRDEFIPCAVILRQGLSPQSLYRPPISQS